MHDNNYVKTVNHVEITLPKTIAYILVASEMLQKLYFTESTFGKYSLTKDIRYFLYSNTMSRLCITRSAMRTDRGHKYGQLPLPTYKRQTNDNNRRENVITIQHHMHLDPTHVRIHTCRQQ